MRIHLKAFFFSVFLVFTFSLSQVFAEEAKLWSVEKPIIVMQGIESQLEIMVPQSENSLIIIVNGAEQELKVINGVANYPIKLSKETICP